jgi:hypothetical protein
MTEAHAECVTEGQSSGKIDFKVQQPQLDSHSQSWPVCKPDTSLKILQLLETLDWKGTKMRIIYVPLYVEAEPFKSHKVAQEKTSFRQNLEDIYWIAGSDSATESFNETNRILTLPIEEKFENIYEKSLAAFRWLLVNVEFDFLIRTNTSTYFDTKKIYQELSKWSNNSRVAAGEFGETQLMSNAPINRGLFLAGTAIILSKETVEQIIELNDSNWRSLPDDVALSMGISEMGVAFSHISRVDLTDFNVFEPGSHYRVKSWDNYLDTASRFFELESLIHTHPVWRFLRITKFHTREFFRYTKAFPLKNGLNLIRWVRQLYRYVRLNVSTWKWIFGLNA